MAGLHAITHANTHTLSVPLMEHTRERKSHMVREGKCGEWKKKKTTT